MDDSTIANNQPLNENSNVGNRSGSKNVANPTTRRALRDISNEQNNGMIQKGSLAQESEDISSSISHVPQESNLKTQYIYQGAASEPRGSSGGSSLPRPGVAVDGGVDGAVDIQPTNIMSGHQSIDLPENRHGQEPENTGSGGKKTESSILPHAPHPQLSVEIITTLIDVERGEEASNSELCRAISAIEELDRQDVTMASEYSDDIFRYMRELELKMLPSHDYMDRQPELQWYMRRILFDWIVQVHERFTLLPETLYLCVNLIDRFLSVKEVSTDKLQLVGITALFIAAKYEELDAPSVSSMVYMTDETYTRDELQKAERYMINLLNYELGFPGPLNFLRRISKSDEYDLSIRTLAKYLVEVTIMYECFIAYPPSLIAACCYYAALRILRKKHWTSTHVHYSGYQEVSLIYCTNQLLMCLEDSTLHTSVYNKYGSSRYMFVSQYVTEYLASCKDK